MAHVIRKVRVNIKHHFDFKGSEEQGNNFKSRVISKGLVVRQSFTNDN